MQWSLKASVLPIRLPIDSSKNSPELSEAAGIQISGVACIYRLFIEGGNANMSIFKMAVWYLLLSHCMCPVIFYLNGFNSVLTACCQWTESAQPLSFRGHQSFIITRIHQPLLVITDYRQPVMW